MAVGPEFMGAKVKKRGAAHLAAAFSRAWNRRRQRNELIFILLTGLAVWAATLVIEAYIGLWGKPLTWGLIALVAVAALGLVATNLKGTLEEARTGESHTPDFDEPYECLALNSAALIDGLIAFDDETYGDDTLPEDVARRIYANNGKCGLALRDCADGRVLGVIEFWPMREESAEAMRRGELSELDVTEADVLSEAEIDQAQSLYVASFAVRGPNTPNGSRYGATLLRCARRFIRQTYFSGDRQAIQLYAFGWSGKGAGAAERLNFLKLCDVAEYGRATPVYARTVNREDLERWYGFDN